ncbi:hypothetical protein SODALDRAFT_358136 [Sodiomyces alkalinus F11]|uniref:GPI anchored serine-rich protein n=1 Tax=Sodiomyces alkalinus (strain CBS 110278 / VKM F-3762 / F11) TaxID=1314773 RepID=A0A3N2PYX0_SODAK|nr:hypothetical protein SODALDRAFT_358136 [Sodiomyces alkalinus F11]ROT39721.1 hypothetical protein SODALDRAFT_358136 [Sodiomyces alkalinus F11]
MRFTGFFTLLAASAAVALPQVPEGEETTTVTSTTTRTITLTECNPTYTDCPLNRPSSTEVVAADITSEISSEVVIPTSEPVVEVPSSSLAPLPSSSSSSSSYFFSAPANTTSFISVATSSLPLSSQAESTESASPPPVVTETRTSVVLPDAPEASGEPVVVPESGAAGLFIQGTLLASVLGFTVVALF